MVINSQERDERDLVEPGIYWLHIASFALYNALIGYLLFHREESELTSLLVYAIAMELHFTVIFPYQYLCRAIFTKISLPVATLPNHSKTVFKLPLPMAFKQLIDLFIYDRSMFTLFDSKLSLKHTIN